jgi:hypothetical protein
MSRRAEHFVIQQPHQDFVLDGVRVAGPVNNRMGESGRKRPRWLSLALYRSLGGMYVVDRTAHSIVAHEKDAPCVAEGKARDRGIVVPVAELPDEVLPCNKAESPWRRCCYPDLTWGVARMEQDLVTVFQSEDPAVIIKWLHTAHHSAGGTTDAASRPVCQLLEQAARRDPAFRIHPVVRIA